MVQEDVEHKSAVLIIKSAKITGRLLAKAMAATLRQIKKSRDAPGRQSAQAVIGAQFEYDPGGAVRGEQARQAAQPAGGGFAADTGVDELHVRRQAGGETGDPALAGFQAVGGAE